MLLQAVRGVEGGMGLAGVIHCGHELWSTGAAGIAGMASCPTGGARRAQVVGRRSVGATTLAASRRFYPRRAVW